jgi:hypothetical protein
VTQGNEPETERISLGSLSEDHALDGLKESPLGRLQRKTIMPMVRFFIRANTGILFGIGFFALVEHGRQPVANPIVTEKVLIAMIGGITVQSAAVIIAAFRGLFSHHPSKPEKPKNKGGHSKRARREEVTIGSEEETRN